jgi:predicted nucleic acid-binding protein
LYFVDTSALVKAYVPEKGSTTVHQAFRQLDGSLYVSRLVAAEALGVFARLLRRKELGKADYRMAHGDLLNHLKTRFYVVKVNEVILSQGIMLTNLHRMGGAGPLDLIHIATAEYLQGLVPEHTVGIMSSDRAMKKAATKRSFDVFDPETDPLTDLIPPELDLR